jgi:hypothetical protein
VPTNPATQSICTDLRRTQSDANAAIDAIIAAFPQFGDVAMQARESTNAKFAQVLATVGC